MLGSATQSTTVTLEETQIISGGSIIVHSVTIENSGALGAIEVVFTNTAGTEILSIAVPANKTFHYKPSWIAEDGLRVTGLRDAGVKVTVTHNDDIAPLAAESFADTKALDFDGTETLYNASSNLLGIANAWSIQINTNPSSDSEDIHLFRVEPDAGDTNESLIAIQMHGEDANNPLRVLILKSVGGNLKDYFYENTWSAGTKVSYIVTWNGTNLLLYVDGVLTSPDTLTTDISGTMIDWPRRVSVGSSNNGVRYQGLIHSTSMWNVVLTQAEVTALQNGGSPQNFDNRYSSGAYVSSGNLQHYWRCGGDASDIGRDFGNAATLIDLGDNAVNLTSDDIVEYVSGAEDTKALDFATDETLMNSTENPLGIANAWSIQINTKPLSDSIDMYLLAMKQTSGNGNRIAVHMRGQNPSDAIRILISDLNGDLIKNYEWTLTYTPGTKVSYILTWNGTNLLLYIDGVLTAATVKTNDDSGTMTATDRRVSIGSEMGATFYTGTIHSTSIWSSVLTQAEVTALQNGGSPQNFDNRHSSGDYVSAANLQHYWRHGFDADDIGKDYGYAATLIDVGDNAVNVTSDDIVEY